MAVQVAARVDVSEADGLSTLDGGAAVAQGVSRPSNAPVAVTVLGYRHPSHRLLATACSHTEHTGSSKALQRHVLSQLHAV